VVVNKKQKGGTRRSGIENRKRGPIIGFRADEAERATIKAAADRAGLTVSSYVRSRALKKPTTRAVRRPPMQTAQLAQLLGLIGAVGGDMQRIAQRVTVAGTGLEAEIHATLTAFREVVAVIMPALGKRRHDH
jgi:hypothetical protein